LNLPQKHYVNVRKTPSLVKNSELLSQFPYVSCIRALMANMKVALYTYITLIYYTALWLGVAIPLVQLQVQKTITSVIFIFVRNALRIDRHQRGRPRKRTYYKV